jgi:hypothetical protein
MSKRLKFGFAPSFLSLVFMLMSFVGANPVAAASAPVSVSSAPAASQVVYTVMAQPQSAAKTSTVKSQQNTAKSVAAVSSMPSGFCDNGYWKAVPWQVSGPKMSKPCSAMGAYIMTLGKKTYGHNSPWSWKQLEKKRAGRTATYYFAKQSSKPSGFCTTPRPNNPGWHIQTGMVFSKAPCAGHSGNYVMVVKTHVSPRFSSYRDLVRWWCKHFVYYEGTLYFEPKSSGCGC